MTDTVFLTDKRKEYISGEFEGTDAAEYSHRHRIKRRSETALWELVQVAASNEIENEDVFTPEAMSALVRAVLGDVNGEPTEYQEAIDDAIDHAQVLHTYSDGPGGPMSENPTERFLNSKRE